MQIVGSQVVVLADPADSVVDDYSITELALLRIETDDGVIGWSELFKVPGGVARAVLDGPNSVFGRLLVGQDPLAPGRISGLLYDSMLHGNRRGWAVMCIGAVDVALWDIWGKATDQPVYRLLGERAPSVHQTVDPDRQIRPYATIISSRYDRDSVLREQTALVERAVKLGFTAVKLEPMQSSRETIVELAQRAREVLGPDGIVAVDVGYLWNDVGMAIEVSERLAAHDVFFLETPFPVDALDAYAALARRSPLRIAAGEHAVTRWEFDDLMVRGGVSVAQPYATTVGGLTEAMKVVDRALGRGVLVCPGNFSTQALGSAHVHLAAASLITPLIEYVPWELTSSPLRKALDAHALPRTGGSIGLPSRSGIGFEPPDDLIEKFRVA